MARARTGKIARLPHTLRARVNRALLDGQTSTELLGWLNSEAAAKRVWDAHYEGAEASPQNLSEWRQGGYRDWIKRNERSEHLRTLSAHAREIAEVGGQSLSSGAAAILAGEIMEAFETGLLDSGVDEEGQPTGPDYAALAQAVTSLKKADIAAMKLKLERERHALREEQHGLNREKFERLTCEKIMEAAKSPEIQAILGGHESDEVKMDELHLSLFGARPDGDYGPRAKAAREEAK